MTRLWASAAVIILVGTLTACKREGKTPPGTASGQPSSDKSSGGGNANPDARQARKAVEEAEKSCHALIDEWLAAQNKGDFERYAALYAPTFRGVRRSGKEKVELDRNGWLADRGRMFKKPMTVTAEQRRLIVDIESGRAEVQFMQSWESGTYKDRGPKRIEIRDLSAKPMISYEEMLSSTILLSATAAAELADLLVDDDSEDPDSEDPDYECVAVAADERRQVCMVVTEQQGSSVHVDLVLVARKGKKWVEVDRAEDSLIVEGLDVADPEELGVEASAAAYLNGVVALGPKKTGVEIGFEGEWMMQEESGHTSRARETALYLVDGDSIKAVLRAESSETGDTDFDSESSEEYEIIDTHEEDGFYTIRFTTSKAEHSWPVDGHDESESSEILRYNPDTSSYE